MCLDPDEDLEGILMNLVGVCSCVPTDISADLFYDVSQAWYRAMSCLYGFRAWASSGGQGEGGGIYRSVPLALLLRTHQLPYLCLFAADLYDGVQLSASPDRYVFFWEGGGRGCVRTCAYISVSCAHRPANDAS